MFDLYNFISGLVVGTVATTLFAWGAIRHYKVLHEISEWRCNRFYDRLLDKESEE